MTKPWNDLDRAAPELAVEGRRRSPALALQDWLMRTTKPLASAAMASVRGLCGQRELHAPAYIEADLGRFSRLDGFADFAALSVARPCEPVSRAGAPTT